MLRGLKQRNTILIKRGEVKQRGERNKSCET